MNSDTETVDYLSGLISSELDRLRQSFISCPSAHLDHQIALIQLLRVIDVFYCRPLFTGTEHSLHLVELYSKGASTALGLFSGDICDSPGVPLVNSTPELQDWADSSIQHAGRIGQLEHLLELVHDGMFEVIQLNKERFEIRARSELVDLEAFDLEDQLWLSNLSCNYDSNWRSILADRLPSGLERMRNLVYPWRGEFIGYDTEPEIDRHYEEAGVAWARSLTGQTELPREAKIGVHPFYAYRAAIGTMCARALKHAGFAGELALMRPDLSRHNILTIWNTKSQWRSFFEEYLEIPSTTAEDLLWSVTLDQDYVESFSKVPVAPLPPLIEVGSNDLAMSLAGCLSNPFWFTLRKLRHYHRSDWDRAMDQREDEFRAELNSLLALPSIVKSPGSITIKCNGQIITDIDAVAYDSKHGTLVLFQLKWQDPFGFSMQERRSRMKNFLRESNKWVGSVSEWLKASGPTSLVQRLPRGSGSSVAEVNRVELVVLGRHHGRFTDSEPPSVDAAWGSWPQICRIATEHFNGGDLLGLIVDKLREDFVRTESPRKLTPGKLKIGEIEIAIILASS